MTIDGLRPLRILCVIVKQKCRDLSHLWLNKLNNQKWYLENLDLLMKPMKNFICQVVLC